MIQKSRFLAAFLIFINKISLLSAAIGQKLESVI
jgi:hypothetical protein